MIKKNRILISLFLVFTFFTSTTTTYAQDCQDIPFGRWLYNRITQEAWRLFKLKGFVSFPNGGKPCFHHPEASGGTVVLRSRGDDQTNLVWSNGVTGEIRMTTALPAAAITSWEVTLLLPGRNEKKTGSVGDMHFDLSLPAFVYIGGGEDTIFASPGANGQFSGTLITPAGATLSVYPLSKINGEAVKPMGCLSVEQNSEGSVSGHWCTSDTPQPGDRYGWVVTYQSGEYEFAVPYVVTAIPLPSQQ